MASLSAENSNLLDEALAMTLQLGESMPSIVDPASISEAKMPYKVLVFREAVLWRTEELARSSCDLIEQGAYCSAIITTRAVMENMAALIYVADFLAAQLEAGLDPDADDRVMALLMGHKNWDEMPQAVNVLTMLKKATKVGPDIGKAYDSLSEYCHPNWAGTSGLFSKHDPEEVLTNFAAYPRGVDHPAAVALTALVGSLKLLTYAYDKIAELLPKFIEVCEEDLRNRS